MRKQFAGGGARSSARALALHGDLDLDLGCLCELADGSKGVIHALGNFGSLHQPPYIQLDARRPHRRRRRAGENLTINLDHTGAFRRILVFVTIYEGARSFAGLHATVTLQPQYGAPVDFSLDECTVPSTVCALALITNTAANSSSSARPATSSPTGRQSAAHLDNAYGWGLDWSPARK